MVLASVANKRREVLKMKKLFGETPQEQLKYLQPRIIITAIAIAISLVGLLFHFEEIAAVLGVVCLMWGWTFLKEKFGIVSLGALFTRNIIAGIVLFVLFLFVGYFFGIVVFIMGLVQYIKLKASGVEAQ